MALAGPRGASPDHARLMAGGVGSGVRFNRAHAMSRHFKAGNHVRWNADAGHVTGTLRQMHTGDAQWNGGTRHCSEDAPQSEIGSDRTDHMAVRTGSALEKA